MYGEKNSAMSEKKSHIHYTIADIQQYLDGKLTAAEMYAIEKAALTDPFLSDAIEGMSSVIKKGELNNFHADITQLKKNISKRKNNKLILWRVAAAVLIVITGLAIIINQPVSSKKHEALATTQVTPKTEEDIAPAVDTQLASVPGVIIKEKKTINKKEDDAIVSAKPSPATGVVSTDKEELALKDITAVIKPDTQRAASPLKSLSGRVPGIQISEKNKHSDANLDSSTQLDEVIVKGYYSPHQSTPRRGWKKYNKYLKQNKRRDTLNPSLKGEVIVSFIVNKNSELSDFIIEKGLSDFYNNEAIRLIKEGPDWKSTGSSAGRISVRIEF
jgi:hypothetical protein